MTPKEKAEELILKFMRLQEPNYNWFDKRLGKQCASIAVDEIMDYLNKVMIPNPFVQYWNEVRKEIENI
jgi:hypothetical protein